MAAARVALTWRRTATLAPADHPSTAPLWENSHEPDVNGAEGHHDV